MFAENFAYPSVALARRSANTARRSARCRNAAMTAEGLPSVAN
jgi:hypothetical protein